ncbi:metallophosphoesterase family protein [Paenibacillus kobensis]|uniref:metallophosphoesterase family protein n=1 Tax=Paenibacillus kobensis TaxID=59841 RepID=UPI000FD91A6C|nr:metallophosphoesterase [Paenibacillus kobensis]
MKVVVVSDTHMPRMGKQLPARLLEELKTADAVIHAGDWTDGSVLRVLRQYAPVYGICGNNDGPGLVRRLGFRRIVLLEKVKVGIVHGHGPGRRDETETRALRSFDASEVDVIVFGHTHIPLRKTREGVLLFNPGSLTDRRRAACCTFGILTIQGRRVAAEHVVIHK